MILKGWKFTKQIKLVYSDNKIIIDDMFIKVE